MTEQIPTLEGQAYHNFVRYTCRNPITKAGYVSQLKKYAAYSNVKNYDELLFGGDVKTIESNIENYLMYLQDKGYASSTVQNARVVVANFYFYNRIQNLNWKIMGKVLKRYRRATNDRPYKREEIQRMLEKCDQRGRIVILLCASSGMRQGAIHTIKLSDLEKIQDVYKITVYRNDPEEYFTFCSYECTKAIDDYLLYRRQCGEIIKPSSPLIREQFDKTKRDQAKNPRHVGVGSIENIIYRAINDSGIREKQQERHEVMQSHGLRKFFQTQTVTVGKMSILYSEMLMGHKDGLAMRSYVKPTTQEMLEEYLNAVDSVTINEENRLQRKVKTLETSRNSEMLNFQRQLDELRSLIRQ